MIIPKNSQEFGRFVELLRSVVADLDLLIDAPTLPQFPLGAYRQVEWEEFHAARSRHYGYRDGLAAAIAVVERVQSDLHASFRVPGSL